MNLEFKILFHLKGLRCLPKMIKCLNESLLPALRLMNTKVWDSNIYIHHGHSMFKLFPVNNVPKYLLAI